MNHDTTGGSHLQVGENTVLSFVTAANLGAEYVEFDVQLTKDRVPVLYHDWTVTETGLGVPVHSLTCNEFLALRPHKHSNRRQGHADPSMAFGGQETKRQAGIAMNVVDTVPGPRRAITSPPKAIPGSQPPPIKPLPRTNRSNSISAHYRPASPNLDPKAVKHSVSGRTDSPEQGTTSRSVSPASSTASHLIEDERVRNILHEELDKIIKGKGLPKKVKGNNAQTIQAPFTTLKEAFQQVPAHIGFNIEVKYPMKCEARGAEVWSHLELNQFVDSILDVVYTHAQQRSVIFSSFHPDICLMLNLKQPNFPVFFLTDGGYFDYVDARCNSLQEAVRFAKNAGLLGIVSVSTLVLQAPVLAPAIKEQGLLLFTYGTLNNNVACVQLQKELDVDAVIVDSVMAVRKSLQDN
ncbi:Glycerophosphocholine phosphodiesterase [Dimargaris verticillata]|uniref:Glycerophosphocholine phosphodiesterase n=1 Tax=Dimargaris verticillata TaxID=2761393 RepID=A0A9W8E707_9FUNG|nr:Glycerophosphocholine phosphodiesterase [Dimargaris verticillata]